MFNFNNLLKITNDFLLIVLVLSLFLSDKNFDYIIKDEGEKEVANIKKAANKNITEAVDLILTEIEKGE